MTRTVIVNGEEQRLQAQTVAELLEARGLGTRGRGFAVAVNDQAVPRSRWAEHRLGEGDRIEIVRVIVGG